MSDDRDDTIRTGGCICGAVRFKVTGEPLRVGLCHCADCRKTSGSAFSAYAVWPQAAYEGSGETGTYSNRSFCPTCGSRVTWLHDGEAEVMLGSLDWTPEDTLTPAYELWVRRRSPWLAALPGAAQFDQDRPPEAAPGAERLPPP